MEMRAWQRRRAIERAQMAEAVFVGSRCEDYRALQSWGLALQGKSSSLTLEAAAQMIAVEARSLPARPWSEFYNNEVH